VIKLPIGSVVKNNKTGELFDIQSTEEKILILKGGNGGRGNESYKSSRNVAPKESTPGEPGEFADFLIELRMFADAGFIGLPSAGKSSLLNELTSAKSKVAAYHFTTLDPHLGALYEFVLADIPGLIEGASSGKGLGIKFLRHIVRTKLLIHVISLEGEDVQNDYMTIRKELGEYSEELLEKPEIIVFSKTDVISDIEKKKKELLKLKSFKGKEVFFVSVYDDESLKAFKDSLVKLLRAQ
jgi:GTP-binding protein